MKKLTLIFILVLSLPAYSLELNDVINFLQDKTPYEVRDKFVQSVSRDLDASSWIVEHDGGVYSLSAVTVKKDKERYVQNSLNAAAIQLASMKSASNLAKYLDNGKTNVKIFENKNAVNHVLTSHYELNAGFSTANMIINGFAFSLVWSQKINSPMSEKDFNKNYCEYLYEQAQDFFASGKFPDALRTFHQIHYMAWANIDSYLGASACFLLMKQNSDAIKLTNELLNTLSGDMTPEQTASAGRILFRAGDINNGFATMEKAYEMLSTK